MLFKRFIWSKAHDTGFAIILLFLIISIMYGYYDTMDQIYEIPEGEK
jgi:hypothetical protein